MTATTDPLTALADGVWQSTVPVRFIGLRLSANMTVLRLRGDELLVHSPVALTPERRAAVDALGRVEHLYAPNTFHHLWLREWIAAYPSARVHAPADLVKKHPGLHIDRPHGEPATAFTGALDEHHVDGFRLGESVLYHHASRTLVVADLVHNVGRPQHGWTAFYTRMNGFYDRVALSRMIRWTAFPGRAAARRSLAAILALPFERITVGHGEPVVTDAKARLTAAYAWLLA